MPTSGGLANAVRKGHEIACQAIQVFTSNPRQWRSSPPRPEQIADLNTAKAETGIHMVVSHDTYLINLCAVEEEFRTKSRLSLIDELRRCSSLGIPYVVSHIGATRGQDDSVVRPAVSEAIAEILAETPEDVTLLMETTAGQGSSLNDQFEDIAALLAACGSPRRLAVCLDTCHIFAAGYDIRTEEAYEDTFNRFDSIVGCSLIKVIHCNDSKKGLGTRVDRHAHIGEGEIGEGAFRILVNDPRWNGIPILLETPDAETEHARNLAMLKSLLG